MSIQPTTNSMLTEQFILLHQDSFYRLAFSYVKNREVAMDLVQDTIVTAIEKSHTLRDPTAIKPWFYRILVNKCMSYLRTAKRNVSLDILSKDILLNEATPSHDPTTTVTLYESLSTLDPKIRTVLILRYFHDMKITEIAYVTNTPQSTVKSRIKRGLKKLNSLLTPTP